MKNLSLIINGVLAVAIAVLFFLHFKAAKSVAKPTSTIGTTGAPGSVIAYVDLDSLQKNYMAYMEKKADFEKDEKDLQTNYQMGLESLQREAYGYQQKQQTMTQQEVEAAQQSLQQKQGQLEQASKNGEVVLQNEMTQFGLDTYSKIDSVLQDYTKVHKLAYVLSYQKGGPVLYRDKGLDITADVIDLLNKLNPPKKK